MEKLSYPACSKGSRLRKRYLKLYLKYFKGETVLSDVDFCRLIRRNLFLLAAGAKKAWHAFRNYGTTVYSNAVWNMARTYCAQNKGLCLFYLFPASCAQSGDKTEASDSFTMTYKFTVVTAFTRVKKRWLRFCRNYTQETGCRHFPLMKKRDLALHRPRCRW